MGTGTSPSRFARVDVPAGGTVTFSAIGEIFPSTYVGSGRGEYQMYGKVRDVSTGTVLYSQWNYHNIGVVGQPYQWIQFPRKYLPGSWTNTSGAKRTVVVEIYSVRTFAGGGIRWTMDVAVAGTANVACRPMSVSEDFGNNPSKPCGCVPRGTTERSVDTRTGNEHWGLPGLSVGGRGPGLTFVLAYNSMAAGTDVGVGHGWRHGYAMRLVLNADGTREVIQEAGSTVPFVAEAGAWVTPDRFAATLVDNGDGTWTFERTDTDTFVFDSAGRLILVTDRNGYSTTLAYDGAGQLVSVEDPAGRELTVTWSAGRITSVSDALPAPEGPRTVSLSYDAAGDLVGYTDVEGGIWVLGYDGSHRLVSARSPRQSDPNRVLEWHYDAQGRVDWEEDAADRRTSLFYGDPVAGATRVVAADGDQRVDFYEAFGVRSKVTYGYGTAAATTTETTYDRYTFMPLVKADGRGKRWLYEYGDVNNPHQPTAIIDPLSRRSEFTYNAAGQVLTATDPTGVMTVSSYDSSGNLEMVTAAAGTPAESVTDLVYDPNRAGDVITVIDGRAKQWHTSYDPTTGAPVSSTDPEGNTTMFETNALGWQMASVAPAGTLPGLTAAEVEEQRTHYTRDRFGRVLTVTNPADEVVSTVYDANGNVATMTNPDGEITSFTYSDADQVLSSTAAYGTADAATTSYSYGADGKVATRTDPLGGVWAYSYDSVGRLSSQTDPNGNVTSYGFDASSNLVTITQPAGNCAAAPKVGCITYSYDDAGQLIAIDYSEAATPDVVDIDYDLAGRRTQQVTTTGTSTWTWTADGQLASETNEAGRSVSYTWDPTGNLTGIVYPGQQVPVVYGFDDAGRMTSVTDWLGNTTNFSYDANSNLDSTMFPAASGNVDRYTYDLANRIDTIVWDGASEAIGSIDYSRDPDGNVTGAGHNGLPAGPSSFGYDDRNQLTTTDATPSYSYDRAGNVTGLPDGRIQVFDPAQQLCWSTTTGSGTCATPPSNATTYRYDNRGNRIMTATPQSRQLYTYDQANRLAGAGVVNTSPVAAGTIVAYTGVDNPAGWVDANGQTLSRATADELFTAIGTTYGAGDGTTTFTLPDLRGRSLVGVDPSVAAFDTVGETGGSSTATLTAAQMPAHTHLQDPHTHIQNSHTHGVNSHSHTATLTTAGNHTHQAATSDSTSGTANALTVDSYGQRSLTGTGYVQTTGNHAHTVDPDPATAANETVTAKNNTTTAVNNTTGSGQPHSNLKPYVTVRWLIATTDAATIAAGMVVPYAGPSTPEGWIDADTGTMNFAGRSPIGLNPTDINFDTLGETGGTTTVTLTQAQMPSHTHTQQAHTHLQDPHAHVQNSHDHANATSSTAGDHSHNIGSSNSATGTFNSFTLFALAARAIDTTGIFDTAGAHTHPVTVNNTTATNQSATPTNQTAAATNQPTGGNQPHPNLQPYLTIRWLEATENTAALPVGSLVATAAPTVTADGWINADGSAANTATNAGLFDLIGTTFGSAQPGSTFTVPDLRGRLAVDDDPASTDFTTPAQTGGTRDVTLTTGQLPAHTHSQNAHTHTQQSHNHAQTPHAHTATATSNGSHTHQAATSNSATGTANAATFHSTNRAADSTSFVEPAGDHTHTVTLPATVITNQSTTPANQATTAVNNTTGNGQPHPNLQPYQTVRWLIASNDTTATYTYNPDGLRTTKTVNDQTTTYTWTTATQLPLLLTNTTPTGDTHLIYGPGNRPVEQIAPDNTTGWYHHDHQGSTRAITDSNGTVLGTYTYNAHGTPTAHTGTYQPLLGYTGEYVDHETGFTYLRARYHDPTTNQFLTRDPLVSVSMDPYGYAGNNPTNNTDPTGLICIGNACVRVPVVDEIGDDLEKGKDLAGDAWDATGGKAVSYVNDHKVGILKGTSWGLAGGAIVASPFTGGTSLSALPAILTLGSGGTAIAAEALDSKPNRGDRVTFAAVFTIFGGGVSGAFGAGGAGFSAGLTDLGLLGLDIWSTNENAQEAFAC